MKQLSLLRKANSVPNTNGRTHGGQRGFLRPGDRAPAPRPWWSPRRGLGAPSRPLLPLLPAALIRVPSASAAERHHGNAARTRANTETVSLAVH